MITRVLRSQTKSITGAAFILLLSSLVSRALGLLRDRLMAGRFGAGEELDVYFAAFRIPDFIYGIFIMGGITAVFLPVFSEHMKKNSREAWEFVNALFRALFVFLVAVSIVLALLAPFIMRFVAPGFSLENRELTVQVTRLLFLSPILFGLSSIFSGILHYFKRFLAYSLAPVMYNLGIIFGILYLVPLFGVFGLAWGVILGAVLHGAVQIVPAFLAGFVFRPAFQLWHPGVMRVLRLALPRTIGAAAFHINLIVMTAIASILAVGSITIFNFANNIQFIPIGLIGISFALASFPSLSKAFAERDEKSFRRYFSNTFRQIVFLVLPVSLLLFLLRAQIIRLILGTGEFGWLETRLTAAALGVFAFGVLVQSLIPFLARAFFAQHDTKSPTVIGLATVVFNVILSFVFVWLLSFSNLFSSFLLSFLRLEDIGDARIVALPLALILSGILQFVLLLTMLQRKGKLFEVQIRAFVNMALAAIVLVAVSYASLQMLSLVVDLQTYIGVLLQATGATVAGLASYLVVLWLLKSEDVRGLWRALKRFI